MSTSVTTAHAAGACAGAKGPARDPLLTLCDALERAHEANHAALAATIRGERTARVAAHIKQSNQVIAKVRNALTDLAMPHALPY